MDLGELRRNDVDGVVRQVEAALDAGGDVAPDEAEQLLLLQDDPVELTARLGDVFTAREAVGRRVPSFWHA